MKFMKNKNPKTMSKIIADIPDNELEQMIKKCDKLKLPIRKKTGRVIKWLAVYELAKKAVLEL